MKKLLRQKKKMKKKKPEFKRQEYFKHKRLKKKWVKPRGKRSKIRMGEKARGKKPSPGFSSPRKVRGLDRHGLKEIVVSNPAGLSKEMKDSSIIIAATVGKRKRNEIIKKAEELGLKISNI